MKTVYHFLGSIRFTLILIAATTAAVCAATVIEGYTGSHQYAELIAYRSPYFMALLAGFFVNILLSTLRRWPFKRRHLPFLLTHLGLLMVLTGVFIKNLWGLQGVVALTEGAGSDQLMVRDQEVLRVEKRGGGVVQYRLPNLEPLQKPHSEILLSLIGREPHCHEELMTWVKGEVLYCRGLPPLPLQKEGAFVPAAQMPLIRGGELWDFYAFHADNPEKAAAELQQSTRQPSVAFIKDGAGTIHLHAFDKQGQRHQESYAGGSPESLYAYDEGFGGYCTVATLPFIDRRGNFEAGRRLQLKQILDEVARADEPLTPPLELLKRASERAGCSFADSLLDFLVAWDREGEWLFNGSLEGAVWKEIDWAAIPPALLNGTHWLSWLLEEAQGHDLKSFLRRRQWPLLEVLEKEPEERLIPALALQLAAVGDRLPPPEGVVRPERLLSAICRFYGIDYASLLPPPPANTEEEQRLLELQKEGFPTLECPVTPAYRLEAPGLKLEENRPLITLVFSRIGGSKQRLQLAYDRHGSGLKWPVLQGQYLVSFQPLTKTLPYRLRLRNARQVYYAHSQQPCGYECSLYISDKGSGRITEATLSMNHVYETWEGHRFYLGNISGDEGELKKVQLIVNYDPAKYWLTYPGGILVAIGALMLFWWRSLK